jgi:hypothetical protein
MFEEGAKAFFLKASKYGVDRMQVDDPVLQNAEFIHFENRENISFLMPQYCIKFINVSNS